MLGLNVPRGLSAILLAEWSFAACVFSQEPQPKIPTPKPLIVIPNKASSSPTGSGPVEIGSLNDFASRLLRHASDAGCQRASCTILVTDFVFPDGSTFPNGIWWADDLSKLFASQENKLQVVDRTVLAYFMQKENISAKTANEESTARWLGKKMMPLSCSWDRRKWSEVMSSNSLPVFST